MFFVFQELVSQNPFIIIIIIVWRNCIITKIKGIISRLLQNLIKICLNYTRTYSISFSLGRRPQSVVWGLEPL